MEKIGDFHFSKEGKEENLFRFPVIVCRVYERQINPWVDPLYAEKRGIPNYEVSLVRWESETEGSRIATAKTGSEGICFFQNLPFGVYTLDTSGKNTPTALDKESFIMITPATNIRIFDRIIRTIRKASEDVLPLTTAQTEVLMLIIQGLTDKEIAAIRNYSPSTIGNTRDQIFKKLGVKSTAKLVGISFQNGWLNSEMEEKLRSRFADNTPRLETLARGQKEILSLIAQGSTVKQIAAGRQTLPSTVNNQIQIICEKLDVKRRANLVTLYYLAQTSVDLL